MSQIYVVSQPQFFFGWFDLWLAVTLELNISSGKLEWSNTLVRTNWFSFIKYLTKVLRQATKHKSIKFLVYNNIWSKQATDSGRLRDVRLYLVTGIFLPPPPRHLKNFHTPLEHLYGSWTLIQLLNTYTTLEHLYGFWTLIYLDSGQLTQ